MATEERIKVNISVEDLQFPIYVANTDEETLYRNAAKEIQRRLFQLRTKYPSLPSEKYYYIMAMLNTFVDAVKTANRVNNKPYMEMMNGLEEEINSLETEN